MKLIKSKTPIITIYEAKLIGVDSDYCIEILQLEIPCWRKSL